MVSNRARFERVMMVMVTLLSLSNLNLSERSKTQGFLTTPPLPTSLMGEHTT